MAVSAITVAIVAVNVVAVSVVTVTVGTVAGFEWPIPAHCPIFSIRDLKSKPGM